MTSQFGKVSSDYAKYRDSLPQEIYDQIAALGIVWGGRQVIELGSGTGIISRDLARLGAYVTGVEPSPQMIEQAESAVLASGSGSVRYVCAAAESFEVDTQVPIIMAVRAWHWFDRERTLQRVDQFLEDNGALIILNSVFRSDSDIAQLTFEVLQTQGIALNPVGSYSSSKLRRNGFPAGWFEEWDQHHLDVIGEWQYDYRLPYDHDAWCGKIRSVSWLADVTEGERIRITEVLRQRLQGHPAMLDVPHQASVVVLRRRRLG